MKKHLRLAAIAAILATTAPTGWAQTDSAQTHVAALKASMSASQAVLKKYEWVETTVVLMDGDEKSRQLKRCYYDVNGKVQKVPVTTPPPPEKKRGLRGRVAEQKTGEMTDYMKSVAALVSQYVPPQPALIQRAKDQSKISVSPKSGNRAEVTFRDYIKPGDSFSLMLDLDENRPLLAKVSTYLNSKSETVTLQVEFDTLSNKSTYAKETVVSVPGRGMRVEIQNSGYHPQ